MRKKDLLAVLAGAALALGSFGPVAAQSTGQAGPAQASGPVFGAVGTVLRLVDGRYADFLTTDISGSPQIVRVDLIWFRAPAPGSTVDLEEPVAAEFTLQRQSDGTYLAREWTAAGEMVNGANFGIEEEWTTRDDSIDARVGNVPEDDEALAQHGEDDDEDDENEDDE